MHISQTMFTYTVKPAFKTTCEIGTTWELRTATPFPRPIQYIEINLRNKTTSEFRTVCHSPLSVPNSQVPLYITKENFSGAIFPNWHNMHKPKWAKIKVLWLYFYKKKYIKSVNVRSNSSNVQCSTRKQLHKFTTYYTYKSTLVCGILIHWSPSRKTCLLQAFRLVFHTFWLDTTWLHGLPRPSENGKKLQARQVFRLLISLG